MSKKRAQVIAKKKMKKNAQVKKMKQKRKLELQRSWAQARVARKMIFLAVKNYRRSSGWADPIFLLDRSTAALGAACSD
jgi:hypothetical protein